MSLSKGWEPWEGSGRTEGDQRERSLKPGAQIHSSQPRNQRRNEVMTKSLAMGPSTLEETLVSRSS